MDLNYDLPWLDISTRTLLLPLCSAVENIHKITTSVLHFNIFEDRVASVKATRWYCLTYRERTSCSWGAIWFHWLLWVCHWQLSSLIVLPLFHFFPCCWKSGVPQKLGSPQQNDWAARTQSKEKKRVPPTTSSWPFGERSAKTEFLNSCWMQERKKKGGGGGEKHIWNILEQWELAASPLLFFKCR